MDAIIYHRFQKRIDEIVKAFEQENITLRARTFLSPQLLESESVDVDTIIIYEDSESGEMLKMIPLLREKKPDFIITVMDESATEKIKDRSLALGADIYFKPPFRIFKIASELKQLVCKRENNGQEKWMRAFDLWLDLQHHFVKRRRTSARLRNKEFALLEFFIINRGRILTRNDILEYVWDRNMNFASNTVDVHVNRLRRKIDDPFRNKLIHTIPCVGYLFGRMV